MRYKRREEAPAEWRVRMDEVQKKYARRLADWLGRKMAKVPRARMRVYVMLVLMGMAAADLALLLHAASLHPPARVEQIVRTGGWVFQVPRGRGSDLVRLLDSLRADSVTGRQLDSLFQGRPGLVDTLKRLGEWVR